MTKPLEPGVAATGGRMNEEFGEDTLLASRLGAAMISGAKNNEWFDGFQTMNKTPLGFTQTGSR